ncbi:unnamed protein product [Knipowitschia caucasica]|uniref:Scaffolding anchor of CK1 domain-containing protein n=3 Tax=Knipowitschia caucasica TaxID=637954 RepID=A0AAV2M826_KNICA
MSNSQEQSLDENAVFLPTSESSPGFLYSETERLALERLLNAGPEGFYSTAGSQLSSSFLSPEEVTNITNWAQDYQLSPKPELWENVLELEDYCSTYYPGHSDTPPPGLCLGWPESSTWRERENSVKVYSSPPVEDEPPVRELIRQHLQKATQVIAIVTDRLTDCSVIGDLHNAASRGVPVYIILNQRSTHEGTVQRLWHPNMQVRVLGGKSFCSRAGRMVVGEMKDKFVLVDLQTVIHGSYSLTWSDAHLHRQLVTVLTGSVVDSFDREFRILFAGSSPVPEPRRTYWNQIPNHINNFSEIMFPKHLPYLGAEVTNPPSPPSDALLDWEAMGVMSGGCSVPNSPLEQHQDVFLKDKPVLNNAATTTDKNTTFADHFFSTKHLPLDKKRLSEPPPPPISPVSNYMSHLITSYSKTNPVKQEPPSPEMRFEKRIEPRVERTVARQISQENTKYDRYLKRPEKEPDPLHNVNTFSHIKRHQEVSTVKDESSNRDRSALTLENTSSSRKPLIIRMPQSEDTSSLSDIMTRIKMKQSTQEHPRDQPRDHLRDHPRDQPRDHLRDHPRDQPRDQSWDQPRERSRTAYAELSRSMVDLSVHSPVQDDKAAPVPRFRAGALDVELLSPALALMQKRNDHIRTTMMFHTPLSFQPQDRPRSFAFSPDWRNSLSRLDAKEDGQ